MSTATKLTPHAAPQLEDRPRKSGPGPIPLVAIVGPTASGKSSLGAWLARKFGGEVLACDSTQVYRGFDIGTAKPTHEERESVPHHLLDLVDPAEQTIVHLVIIDAARVLANELFPKTR